MMFLIFLLTCILINTPTNKCTKELKRVEIFDVGSERANTFCRGAMLGNKLDNGEPYDPEQHVLLGCFSTDGYSHTIVYDGDWRTLNHELNHAKNYLCQ